MIAVDSRTSWRKAAVADIQRGSFPNMRCIMATTDRIAQGLCLGQLPEERISRGQHTCSPECQEDKRRVMRELRAMKSCRFCGHGLTKKQRSDMAAESRRKQEAKHAN